MRPASPPPRPLQILLPTLGSAGDVHPTIALALALEARGHRTVILTSEFYGEHIRAAGIEFIALGTIAEGERILGDPRLWNPSKAFSCFAQLVMLPNLPRLYQLIEQHADSRAVVAASGICLGARLAHEKLGVPLATVHLQPSMLRSFHDAGMVGRLPLGPGVPSAVKRVLFLAADKFLIDRELAPGLNAFRGELGLAPVHRIFANYIHSPQPVLGMFNDWFAPIQPDWPPNLHLWASCSTTRARARNSRLKPRRFSPRARHPCCSCPALAPPRFTTSSANPWKPAAWPDFAPCSSPIFRNSCPPNLPGGVRAFAYLPFSQVLPRCAVMVYPGGIGTMAQTIHAGVPHLVVPHAHDQPDNAARVQHLGLGKFIYPENYRAAKVALLLKDLFSDSALADRCKSFSARVQSEAALERACTMIEGLAPQSV